MARRLSLGMEIMRQAEELAAISEEPGILTRTFLTAQHKLAGEKIIGWMRAAGMTAEFDAIGNVVGRYEGRVPGLPALLLGSHLDTVRDAGRYDGMLGVLSAIACVGELHRQGVRPTFAIEVFGFADEEGARFQSALSGSRAVAGTFDAARLDKRDSQGTSMGEALRQFGLDPGRIAMAARRADQALAFVELHIEQGPLLEAENKTIGVVDRGQGIIWYDGKIVGFESHAGTTPMPLRRDALATLSEIVLAVESIATKHGPHAVGTVGEAVIAAPSRNVIPGEIAFTVDVRSPESTTLDAIDADLRAAIAEIAPRRKTQIDLTAIWRKPPTIFDPKLVDAVEASAKMLGYSHRRITSGAGHDACNLATVMPAAMVFVPCKDGVSHNELEDATQLDCAAGGNVLLHTVLALAGVAS
jgi:N-carbamoyl-L-amino-acid hydrolase